MSDSSEALANLNGASAEGTANDAAEMFASLLSGEKKREEAPQAEPEARPEKEANQPDQPADKAEPEEPRYKVKVSGQEIEVPLKELLNGYSRDSDYRAKTMTLAEEKRAVEAERQRITAERQQAASVIQVLQQQLPQVTPPDPRLIDADPVQYIKQRAAYEEAMVQRQQLAQYHAQIEEQNAQQRAQAQRQFYESQAQALVDALPDWKDNAKATEEKKAIREHLLSVGFSESDVNSVVDHRAVVMARESMLYRKMVAEAQAAAKQVKGLPPRVERPGVSQEVRATDGRTQAMQQLRRSGSTEAAANLFEKLL